MLIREEIDDNSTVLIDADSQNNRLSFHVNRNGGLSDSPGHVADILLHKRNSYASDAFSRSTR